MELYSTNNPGLRTSLRDAIFQGLPDDNGLFMPVRIPKVSDNYIRHPESYTFQELAFEIARTLIGDEIPEGDLKMIIEQSITFPAPVISLDKQTRVLELFHGPSLAFKDFGARFMAQTMSYFNREETEPLTILVATSGDTGGAVAAGFLNAPGIRVVILYPSGKVSPLQEKQLTTLGHNIHALEVSGTFDDCQHLVKQAFLDQELRQQIRMSSANSINISRLIPQVFYYWEAYKQISTEQQDVIFVVPSGNFGNLTAGLIAQKMGLAVRHFIAATNVNDVVPEYLETGTYTPRPSIRTISNAMDVGAPSNFSRILDLYSSTWNIIKTQISGYGFTDEQTRAAMQTVYQQYQYILDPHGAVGYLAWKKFQQSHPDSGIGIILETAHPTKFLEEVETTLKIRLDLPETLARLKSLKKEATMISTSYTEFKTWLLQHLN
ncbi:MAG: threonine synthase [Bacteroidetes bacterium]|nr:MAG: threonine synthase [Bacteroidota bacterium]